VVARPNSSFAVSFIVFDPKYDTSMRFVLYLHYVEIVETRQNFPRSRQVSQAQHIGLVHDERKLMVLVD
jgi:hypothetical protein